MQKVVALGLWGLLVAILLASDTMPVGADEHQPSSPQAPATPPEPFTKHPKFSTSVAMVAEAVAHVPPSAPVTTNALASYSPSTLAYFDTGLLRLDEAGRLQVYIRVSELTQEVRDALAAVGVVLEQEDAERRIIQASVPLQGLEMLASLEYVTAVTAPKYGHVNVGSKLTQGDTLLGFDSVRANYGVNGSGVTVGVISDGILGLESAIASGDLPVTTLNRDGGGGLISTTGGVIATSFRADGDLEGDHGAISTDAEGTAIMEIIHDIAPGAQLRFANFDTHLEFIAAVDFLAANSDVVIDDIGFLGFAYDQTSPVSTNTAAELNKARVESQEVV